MSRLTTGLAMLTALLVGGLIAVPARAESKPPAKAAGVLHVYGNADTKLFTEEGIKRAEATMHGTQFDHGLMVTVDTYSERPSRTRKRQQMRRSATRSIGASSWRTGSRNGPSRQGKGNLHPDLCRNPVESPSIGDVRRSGARLQRLPIATGILEKFDSRTQRSREEARKEKLKTRDTVLNDGNGLHRQPT